jgi:hypothetical protein
MEHKFSSGKTSGISSHYLVNNESNISLFETYEPTPEPDVKSNKSVNSTVKKFNGQPLDQNLRVSPLKIGTEALNCKQEQAVPIDPKCPDLATLL